VEIASQGSTSCRKYCIPSLHCGRVDWFPRRRAKNAEASLHGSEDTTRTRAASSSLIRKASSAESRLNISFRCCFLSSPPMCASEPFRRRIWRPDT
jgi:hypothetical protein